VKAEELGVIGLGGHQDLDDNAVMPVVRISFAYSAVCESFHISSYMNSSFWELKFWNLKEVIWAQNLILKSQIAFMWRSP
jgi:hypothetical protein